MNFEPTDHHKTVTSDQTVRYSDVAGGLAYLHHRSNEISQRTLEAASFTYALIEILVEKEIISLDEINTRQKPVATRLLKRFIKHDAGIAIQEPNQDKYTFSQVAKIDCEDRVHLCKSACCKMVFPLSQQDIEEGIIKWELSQPYVIAKGTDGYCTHLDRQCLSCTAHDRRPIPCRAYDCRQDTRIWLDFEKKVVNPKLDDPNWPHNLTPEEMELPGSELK